MRLPLGVIGGCLLLGAVLRVAVMFGWDLSGDDATVALMARHYVTGEAFPVFFYRQIYMGALNGIHLVPAAFLFGLSPLVVRLNAIAWSLLFPLGVYLLGRRLYDEATARVALVLAACPSFLLTYWSQAAEPHFETSVLGVYLLTLAAAALQAGAGSVYQRRLAVLGLVGGVSVWANPKALVVLIPVLAVLWGHDPRLPRRPGAWMAVAGFGLGYLPAALFDLIHRRTVVPGQEPLGFQFGLSLHRLGVLVHDAVPFLLGGYYFPYPDPAQPGARAALAANVTVYCVAVVVALAELWRRRAAIDARWWGRAMLALALVAPLAAVYVSRHVAVFNQDVTRYAMPAWTPLLLFAAGLVVRLGRWRLVAGGTLLAGLLGFNLWTHVAFAWPLDPEMPARGVARVERMREVVATARAAGTDALYLDTGFGSLRWALAAPELPVSDLTTEIYVPHARRADAAARIAIVAERYARAIGAQLDGLGVVYRTESFDGLVLFTDLHVPPRTFRLVSRAAWRVAGDAAARPALADDDLGTTWPTTDPGLPRESEVNVDLGASRRVGRLVWWPVTTHEHTVPLAVAGSADGHRWIALGVEPAPRKWPGQVASGRPAFRPRLAWLELRVAAQPIRFLRFRPAETDAAGEWGVGELYVYEDAGPAPTEAPDVPALLSALRAWDVRRLLADPVTGARVALATGDAVMVPVANEMLDSQGGALPPARLATPVTLRPTDGLLVPREDLEDLRARLAVHGLPTQETPLGSHVLVRLLEPPVPLAPCRRTRWRVVEVVPGADEGGARYRLHVRLQERQRVDGLRVTHSAVPARHAELGKVEAADDRGGWRPVPGVRRVTEWAWGGRTLLAVSGGADELALGGMIARELRLEVALPNRDPHAITGVCSRGQVIED